MEISKTYKAEARSDWREWLEHHHCSSTEIWLILQQSPCSPGLSYLDAVEEAICFGWIDGISKKINTAESAQRFTPRKARSNWTELNKERARRLIRLGFMTDAGLAVIPDLDAEFQILVEIESALRSSPVIWENFKSFPALYRRVRIGYIQEMRKNPVEFERRLGNFIKTTAQGKMFGNWSDGGLLS
jgi:uncharacterized protein YdeI (YjbR/CyaY-like superfamily)